MRSAVYYIWKCSGLLSHTPIEQAKQPISRRRVQQGGQDFFLILTEQLCCFYGTATEKMFNIAQRDGKIPPFVRCLPHSALNYVPHECFILSSRQAKFEY